MKNKCKRISDLVFIEILNHILPQIEEGFSVKLNVDFYCSFQEENDKHYIFKISIISCSCSISYMKIYIPKDIDINEIKYTVNLYSHNCILMRTKNFKQVNNKSLLFNFGIASGDPEEDGFVLWTHASNIINITNSNLNIHFNTPNIQLRYEISEDVDFKNIIKNGNLITNNTGTVKVIINGLKPYKNYYYRFIGLWGVSETGKAKTLPSKSATLEKIRIATLSCSNLPSGYFNVYNEIAKKSNEIDFAIHLGDYIYEYGPGGFGTQGTPDNSREPLPSNELFTLQDYRTRHAQYKLDPYLKSFHKNITVITIWDDHEIADDAYKDGSNSHNENINGLWKDRATNAIKAYHEWLPTKRHTEFNNMKFDNPEIKRYFKLELGDLINIYILETRLVGRDQKVKFSDIINPSKQEQAFNNLNNPNRQMLGQEQETWLFNELEKSNKVWDVLGEQVIIGETTLPITLLQILNIQTYNDPNALQEAIIATEEYNNLNQEQKDQIPKISWKLDTWNGYVGARNRIYNKYVELNKKLVVLSGDSHNAWNNTLKYNNSIIGREFSVSSVSSPGFEKFFPGLDNDNGITVYNIFKNILNPESKLIGVGENNDELHKGFNIVEFTRSHVKNRWIFIDDISNQTDYNIYTYEKTYDLNMTEII